MNLVILFFLAFGMATFAVGNPIFNPMSIQSKISKREALPECLSGDAAHEQVVEHCLADFLSNAADMLRDPNVMRDRKASSAKICSLTQGAFECIRKIIVENCGEEEATPIAKEIFQQADVSEKLEFTDKSVAECKQLDEYVESGGAGVNTGTEPLALY
ncbi:hypothetical protein DdX_13902 [Ditylenchus destructor]|uniref:Uncharacterized protein n=1 Tax=Ditylenchus destructor TaxID=166010 RepID=A0AAD4MV91_9BILA|nr:hypothetical protein DdX_13902 [Ditylenchus destructor]